MPVYKIQKPFIFTLFGASGDLARLKIYPSLYQLAVQKRLPDNYFIVGFSRTKQERSAFVNYVEKSIRAKEGKYVVEPVLRSLLEHIHYFNGQYTERQSFDQYRQFLQSLTGGAAMMHLSYFSVPPVVFKDIVKHLADTRPRKNEDLRLIIEKPFGGSRASAEELFHFVIQHIDENQVYLLDHYLGKSSVQSIMHLRHANRLLNMMMRGSEIANIQVTAFEDIGINERVGYFDDTGIIKDMIQSHILQTLAMVTMSIPITESADSIHRERYSILSAIQAPRSANDIVIGQYASYKKESGVPKHSTTETFVAIRLFIDREDWHRVPIYLRTAKKTDEKHTFVTVEFKKFSFQKPTDEPNRLVIDLQPNASITINLVNRLGELQKNQDVMTSASIACDIEGCLPDHAALILDAMRGDKTYFLSFPEILQTWRITDDILRVIKEKKIKLEPYADGSRDRRAKNNSPDATASAGTMSTRERKRVKDTVGITMDLQTFSDEQQFIDASVAVMISSCSTATTTRLALSGGRAVGAVYRAFADDTRFTASMKFDVFTVDERNVPSDNPDSNWKLITESFITPLETRADGRKLMNVGYPFTTDIPLEQALMNYEKLLRHELAAAKLMHEPLFHLTILGLGPDGHTASLFPHSPALHEKERLVAHTTTDQFAVHDRLTLTFPAIMASEKLLLLMRGKEKEKILDDLLHSSKTIDELPAKKLLEHPGLTIHFAP